MDNLGKAIQMGGSALLFVVAISVSIFLYNSVFAYVDTVIMASDVNNRVEYSSMEGIAYKRSVTRAEVIMALVSINNNDANSITVKKDTSRTYTKGDKYENTFYIGSYAYDVNTYYFSKTEIPDGKYSIKYTFDVDKEGNEIKHITYTLEEEE